MRVKPYRVCDICGREFYRSDGFAKVKVFERSPTVDDILPIAEKVDLCINCYNKMCEYIINERNELVEEEKNRRRKR